MATKQQITFMKKFVLSPKVHNFQMSNTYLGDEQGSIFYTNGYIAICSSGFDFLNSEKKIVKPKKGFDPYNGYNLNMVYRVLEWCQEMPQYMLELPNEFSIGIKTCDAKFRTDTDRIHFSENGISYKEDFCDTKFPNDGTGDDFGWNINIPMDTKGEKFYLSSYVLKRFQPTIIRKISGSRVRLFSEKFWDTFPQAGFVMVGM